MMHLRAWHLITATAFGKAGRPLRSRRFFSFRRHAFAEKLDSCSSRDAASRNRPEITFSLGAQRPSLYSTFRGAKWDAIRGAREEWRLALEGSAHGIRCSQRPAVGILLNVDQHAAAGLFATMRSLVTDWVLGSHRSRDNLSEGTQLLISVNRSTGK